MRYSRTRDTVDLLGNPWAVRWLDRNFLEHQHGTDPREITVDQVEFIVLGDALIHFGDVTPESAARFRRIVEGMSHQQRYSLIRRYAQGTHRDRRTLLREYGLELSGCPSLHTFDDFGFDRECLYHLRSLDGITSHDQSIGAEIITKMLQRGAPEKAIRKATKKYLRTYLDTLGIEANLDTVLEDVDLIVDPFAEEQIVDLSFDDLDQVKRSVPIPYGVNVTDRGVRKLHHVTLADQAIQHLETLLSKRGTSRVLLPNRALLAAQMPDTLSRWVLSTKDVREVLARQPGTSSEAKLLQLLKTDIRSRQ